MTERIDATSCDDPRDAVHRAVAALADGRQVALPADGAYIVATQSSRPRAVERLREESAGGLSLTIRGVDELLDYCPGLSETGLRLARRLWPGPVILEVPLEDPQNGLAAALPHDVHRAVSWDGGVRLAIPGHHICRSLQRLAASPLVLAHTWGAERAIATSSEEILELAGANIGLVLDAGPIQDGGSSTVVRIAAEDWKVMHTGMLDEADIQERIPFGVVFVCTGNTCRSPLAAAILRKMLAERLECESGRLADRGFFVASAGISADYGMPAASESLALADEHGLDLASHQSQALSDALLDRADRIYAMTAAHRDVIVASRPDLDDRVELLSREGIDIIDPIGGGPAEYERCRIEIEREILVILEQLPIDQPPSR